MGKELLLDMLNAKYQECLTRWHIKISKWDGTDEEKTALSKLFSFMLNHMDLSLSNQSVFLSKLQEKLLSDTTVIPPDHFMFVIGSLEQIIMEIVLESCDYDFVHQSFHKIHSLCMNLSSTLMHQPFLSLHSPFFLTGESHSPLVQLLKSIKIHPHVRWNKVAVITSPGKILDLSVYDPEKDRWLQAFPTERQSLFVQRILQERTEGFTIQINRELTLAIKGSKNPLSRRFAQELTHWIRHALKFSHKYTKSHIHDVLRQYEAVMELDNSLLTTSGIQDTLFTSMKQICHMTGFQRSAFFWYYPFSKKVEGIFSYNVPLEEIQQIHETEQNVPGISKLFDVKRPVYFRQVRHLLPKHHVEHFRLTSLLVAPLFEENHHVTGVLLLDQNGRPFNVSQTTIETLRTLLTRVSRNLSTKLSANHTAFKLSSPLSRREKQILELSADGFSTKQIASKLKISEHTVNEYIRSVFKKLQAKNRAEAVAKALRQQWIQ